MRQTMECTQILTHEMRNPMVPEKEHQLRVLLAQMENKCIYQRIQFIGDPWTLLQKAEELKRIINQVPQPNLRINRHQGD